MSAVATAGGLPTRLGKYEILTPLATGGMARIYVARATGIGSFERHVVLKLITPERASDKIAVQMFLDEARLAAALNHQNVAQVFEVGEDAGIHYLAMEYVHGQDLRALLAKCGSQGTRIPLELALTVVAGAAAGLNHAHERRDGNGVPLGIVHRDVSPSNIMIGLDGAVKLLDFGIAKATARSVETVSGIIKGKFAYMAPEQCRGREVDRRSDVFSLGIILYEITTQHRCFRADSDFDTMHRIVTGDVVRPTRLVQGYPPALEAVVMKALAVDANQRYQSAGHLLEAIEAFAVSARMSLSTMSLGRFMREMFGETPEPWLQSNRAGSLDPDKAPRESTISNTNGTSEPQPAARGSTPPPTRAQVAEAQQDAAATLLELPRGSTEIPIDEDADASASWNAKSYPTMPPTSPVTARGPSSPSLPTVKSPVVPVSAPPASDVVDEEAPTQIPAPHIIEAALAAAMASASPPSTEPASPLVPPAPPPAGAFPEQHSASSRSHPSLPVVSYKPSTHQSAEAYALAPDSLASMKLRPARWPLVLGFVVVVGIAIGVVVFLGFGGGDVEPAETVQAHQPPVEGSNVAVNPAAPDVVNDVPAPKKPEETLDENVHLDITTDPPGAIVMLGNENLGKTPIAIDHKRGDETTPMLIRLEGYEEVSLRVDLTGDYSKKLTLRSLRKPDPEVKEPKPPKPPKPDTTTNPPKPPKPPKPDNPPKPPPKPLKPPDCQIPGQQIPFDPRPLCKT